MKREIVEIILPANWASALVNNDWSGLEYYDREGALQAKAWQMESGLQVLGCGDEEFIGKFDGKTYVCMTFYCASI